MENIIFEVFLTRQYFNRQSWKEIHYRRKENSKSKIIFLNRDDFLVVKVWTGLEWRDH